MKHVFKFLVLFRRERQPGDLVFATGFFVFAICAAALLPSQTSFFAGKALVGQPGFWPALGVAMMILFGAAHLIATINAPRLPGRLHEVLIWLRAMEYVAWFIGYVLLVPLAGYLPATVGFALVLAIRLGYRSARALAAAAAFGLCVVLVFRAGLGVRLPSGAIYEYLPDGIRNIAMVYL